MARHDRAFRIAFAMKTAAASGSVGCDKRRNGHRNGGQAELGAKMRHNDDSFLSTNVVPQGLEGVWRGPTLSGGSSRPNCEAISNVFANG